MTNEVILNDPITVTASIDHKGHIVPKNFVWRGEQHTLIAVGRQWDADDGRHVLVQAATGARFEIQLSRQDLLWYLKRAWQEELAA